MNRLARRQRAALALFIALTVSGVGVAMATPQSGDQPGVTLDVSPSDGQNLPTPQTLTVTGVGFPASTGIILVQAATLSNGTTALSDTIGTATTSPSGTFSTNVSVTRTFTEAGSGQTIDCNTAGVQCYVQAFSSSGNAQSQHTISFAGGGTTTTSTTLVVTTSTSTTLAPTTSTSTSTTLAPTTTSTSTSTTLLPTTSTSTSTSTSTTLLPTTSTSTSTSTTLLPTTSTSTSTSTTLLPTTSTSTSTTLAPTTTTIGGPTTTLGATQCAQLRAARAQLNAQIDAARAAILQSGLSAQQQAAALAQLEAIRAQGNAQLDALLAGCPAP